MWPSGTTSKLTRSYLVSSKLMRRYLNIAKLSQPFLMTALAFKGGTQGRCVPVHPRDLYTELRIQYKNSIEIHMWVGWWGRGTQLRSLIGVDP